MDIIYIYNVASPENNEYKIGDPPCGGLAPCTDADHQFCTIIVFRARYVICCWLCILGQVDAILGAYFEHFGVTWVYLGAILGNVGSILGPLWEVLGVLGSTLELRV